MSSAIHKLLATEVVEVYQEACKNYRNKTVTCRICVDCCSEEAISLQNQIPIIIDKKCIDCGACVSECPVNAIDHISKPYAKIAEYVDNYPEAEITCDRVEEFNRGVKVPCLLYLDAPTLSQYADKREAIHIYTGHCNSCGKVSEGKISAHFEKIERNLEALGITFEIKTKTQLPQSSSEQTVNAVSRRDLFSKFSLANIREFILPTSPKNDMNTLSEEPYQSLSIIERMHVKKKLLNKFYDSEKHINVIEHKTSDFSFSFYINDNCNGCTVCERICPTKAIYWETNESVSQLVFDSHLCVECNKCLACPVDALTKSESLPVDMEEKKELISMNIVRCLDCGETFKTTKKISTTCFFCKAKKEKEPTRFFTN